MDWNGNLRPPFPSRPDNSLSFLYNYNYDHYPGLEMMKYPVMAGQPPHGVVGGGGLGKNMMRYGGGGNQQLEKKKRLTSDQLDSLETSFQEEIKLDPDRKMKLARELGLQPRQVAIWFQNRRARWKAKQLEQLYDGLKQEFDVVSREKQKLQEEVVALRAMIKDHHAMKNQVSTGNTEISGEDTVESTSVGNQSSGKPLGVGTLNHHHNHQHHQQQQMADQGNYVFNVVDDYNPVMAPPYWGTVLPSYP